MRRAGGGHGGCCSPSSSLRRRRRYVRVSAQSAADAFASSIGELREAGYADKEAIAERMIAAGHPNTRQVLTALLEDRLFVRNADQKVVIVKTTEGDPASYELVDPVSLTDAGTAPPDSLARIGTNNRLRRSLRTTLARFGLSHPDAAERLAAVNEMLRSLDESTVQILRERLPVETDSSVRAAIDTGIAMGDLDGTDPQARLAAVGTLSSRLSADARNRLARLVEKSPDGAFVESDPAVREAAQKGAGTYRRQADDLFSD